VTFISRKVRKEISREERKEFFSQRVFHAKTAKIFAKLAKGFANRFSRKDRKDFRKARKEVFT
jgi:hypothetical protein